jgi:penicillin amidase
VKKEKFTIKDVYNIFDTCRLVLPWHKKTDPLLTDIRNKYGMEYLKDFGLDGELNTTINKMRRKSHRSFSDVKISGGLIRQFTYLWGVTAGLLHKENQKRKSDIANDPHIVFAAGTWYEAHIVTPEFELYGCYLAGTPFPLLGHNRDYAYGLTMFQNDDIDFYQERIVQIMTISIKHLQVLVIT